MKNFYKFILTASVAVLALASCQPAPPADVHVSGVKLNKTTLTFTEGESAVELLVATITPDNATNKKVSWKSSDEKVAAVSENGQVTPGSVGNAFVTVTTEDGGYTAKCAVEVKAKAVPVTDVILDKSELSIGIGAQETLVATVLPAEAGQKLVKWTSDNEAVATVENGVVSGIGKGVCTVTAASVENPSISASCQVTVTAAEIKLDADMITTNAPMQYQSVGQDASISAASTDPFGFGGSPDWFFYITEEQAANRLSTFATVENMWDNDPETCFHTNTDWGVPYSTWGNREDVNFGQHYIQVTFVDPKSNLEVNVTANGYNVEGLTPYTFGVSKTLNLFYILDEDEADWELAGTFENVEYGAEVKANIEASNIKALRFQANDTPDWTYCNCSLGIAELKIFAN